MRILLKIVILDMPLNSHHGTLR